MGARPLVTAFLICDYVIHEQDSNKKSCIGIFHQISTHHFPCRHGQLSIYANISDAQGEYVFRLSLQHLAGNREIGAGSTPPLRIPDRLQTAELAFRLQNIVFPEPGKYQFQLFANEDLVAQKEVVIRKIDPPARPRD